MSSAREEPEHTPTAQPSLHRQEGAKVQLEDGNLKSKALCKQAGVHDVHGAWERRARQDAQFTKLGGKVCLDSLPLLWDDYRFLFG